MYGLTGFQQVKSFSVGIALAHSILRQFFISVREYLQKWAAISSDEIRLQQEGIIFNVLFARYCWQEHLSGKYLVLLLNVLIFQVWLGER